MLFTYITIRGHKNNGDPLGCFPGLDILAFETGYPKRDCIETYSKIRRTGSFKCEA
jgi:hypothetical protein